MEANYAIAVSEIVEGIERSKVVMLMCSAASMRSRNVKHRHGLAAPVPVAA